MPDGGRGTWFIRWGLMPLLTVDDFKERARRRVPRMFFMHGGVRSGQAVALGANVGRHNLAPTGF